MGSISERMGVSSTGSWPVSRTDYWKGYKRKETSSRPEENNGVVNVHFCVTVIIPKEVYLKDGVIEGTIIGDYASKHTCIHKGRWQKSGSSVRWYFYTFTRWRWGLTMSKPLHQPTEKTRAEIVALRSYGVPIKRWRHISVLMIKRCISTTRTN